MPHCVPPSRSPRVLEDFSKEPCDAIGHALIVQRRRRDHTDVVGGADVGGKRELTNVIFGCRSLEVVLVRQHQQWCAVKLRSLEHSFKGVSRLLKPIRVC
mmetsp:Transcript_436/g.795  ORF Transcript_436/g.795 Transcript_436/m.795 type:complete len:100 (+) Transcript_436:57-356(+)